MGCGTNIKCWVAWFEGLFGETKKQIWDAARRANNESASSQMPGRHNGPSDAYTHILWAAELTRLFGPDQAYIILEYHEWVHNWNEGCAEYSMDSYNNSIGIEIGSLAESWDQIDTEARRRIDPNNNGDPGYGKWLPTWTANPRQVQWPPRWPEGPYPPPPDMKKPPIGNWQDWKAEFAPWMTSVCPLDPHKAPGNPFPRRDPLGITGTPYMNSGDTILNS